MWRSTGDIFDSWESIKDLTKQQAKLHPYHSVGCFNDMDMLVVGMYWQRKRWVKRLQRRSVQNALFNLGAVWLSADDWLRYP